LGGGEIIIANLHQHAVNMPLRTLAHHYKRLSPLLAAPAVLLLSQGQAKAVLTYNIFESGGNVVVQTSGSLNLTGAQPNGYINCQGGNNGGINPSDGMICTGNNTFFQNAFSISGPGGFNGSAFIFPADSVSGIFRAC
jgi:hypothetical protein